MEKIIIYIDYRNPQLVDDDIYHGTNKVITKLREEGIKRFDLVFDEEDLTDEEVFAFMQDYKKADGQWVYKGDFLSMETIREIVRSSMKKVIVYTLTDEGAVHKIGKAPAEGIEWKSE